MSHVRQQIREQVAAYLTGLATTGSNVFQSRPRNRPTLPSQTPALHVYTEGEDDAAATLGGPIGQLDRILRVRVALLAVQDVDFDDLVDTMLAEVETKLNSSTTVFTVNGLAKGGIRLDSIDDPEFEGGAEEVVARVVMNWVASYRTTANDPTTAI